jgi:hypothetical protein
MTPLLFEPAIPHYELRNVFAYNLRCIHCRMEVEHSEALHLLQLATYPNDPIQDEGDDEVVDGAVEASPVAPEPEYTGDRCKHCHKPCVHSSGVCALCLMGNHGAPYRNAYADRWLAEYKAQQ